MSPDLLGQERGELTKLEQDVVQSLADHETLAENIEAEWVGHRTVGEQLSDHLRQLRRKLDVHHHLLCDPRHLDGLQRLDGFEQQRFDPYPYILLNLVLSCLAAIQAPIIMMSQKRQEAKDRLRSENDYRVNLKAELEIRHLHEKIDHILTRQWERLAEIQQIQLEMMQDPALRKVRAADSKSAVQRLAAVVTIMKKAMRLEKNIPTQVSIEMLLNEFSLRRGWLAYILR